MEDTSESRCLYCGEPMRKKAVFCHRCGTYTLPLLSEEPIKDIPSWEKRPETREPAIVVFTIIFIVVVIASLFTFLIILTIQMENQEGEGTYPTVIRTDPENGSMNVSPIFSLKIFFSEPMTNCTTLHYDLWQIVTDESETIWIDSKTAEITNLTFSSFGTFTVHFYGNPDLQDEDGNYLEGDYEWTFTTRPPKVDILSMTTFRYDSNATMIYIYGELKNNESFNLIIDDFVISGYDSNQNFVGTSYFYSHTSPYFVKPGEIVPFMSHYRDNTNEVEEITVEIGNNAYIVSYERYEGLEIVRSEGYFDTIENYTCYIINGTVVNNGHRLAERVTITATFYDSDKKVVAAYEYYNVTYQLNITETSDFEIDIYEGVCNVLDIDSYRLIAHEIW